MSSLFSIDSLLLQEDVNNDDVINLDNIGYYNYSADDFSFTNEGFRFVLEMQRDYINANKYFYDTLLESGGSDEIINEGFAEFWDGIKRIIKKFLDWLKKVCKEFAIKLMGLFKSDKYLKNKKNQDLLRQFSDSEEFEYNGYEYTNLEPNIPLNCACDAIEQNGLKTLDQGVTSMNGTYADDKYKDALNKQYDELSEGQDDFNDAFRARVIGKNDDTISAGDYADELFEFFRDDASSPSAITIDAAYVTEALIRFNRFKDTIKDIEKLQKEMTKDYNKLETVLNRLIDSKSNNYKNNGKSETGYEIKYRDTTSNSYASSNVGRVTSSLGDEGTLGTDQTVGTDTKKLVSRDVSDAMNKLCKLLSTRVTQMCSIHTQAFSARLQAEKDRYTQDKAILYKALARVEHNVNKKK